MYLSFRAEIIPIEEVPLEDAEINAYPTYERPVVMVVDDEPMVTDTLAAILTRSGYRTLKAYDGLTALRLAAASPPSLLISDVAMPGMNGVELAMALTEMVPGCRVLLLSGHATRADLDQALAAGCDFSLLTKPVPPLELLANVSLCLGVSAGKPHPTAMVAGRLRHELWESA